MILSEISFFFSLKMGVEANLFSFSDEVQLSSEAMGVYEIQARLRDTSHKVYPKLKNVIWTGPLNQLGTFLYNSAFS